MPSEKHERGQKRSKSYYRKCAYGGKRPRLSANILEAGIRGFLVMCNSNEKSAVRESYNILNEYADSLYGREKFSIQETSSGQANSEANLSDENTDEDDDVEKAMKKEVDGIKSVASSEKRFQNVLTKAKNCVFIRTTLENPPELVNYFMEDIGKKKLRRARYAARILPIIGTCKANTGDIEKLAAEVLTPIFSPGADTIPQSYSIIFKARNNNLSCCGRDSVVSSLIQVVKKINPEIEFKWSGFSMAVLVEVVCTVCCLGLAPHYTRLRKYNLQELTKGTVDDEADTSHDPTAKTSHDTSVKEPTEGDGAESNSHQESCSGSVDTFTEIDAEEKTELNKNAGWDGEKDELTQEKVILEETNIAEKISQTVKEDKNDSDCQNLVEHDLTVLPEVDKSDTATTPCEQTVLHANDSVKD